MSRIRYKHADGGLYRMAGPGKLKSPETGEWHEAMFYYDEEAEMTIDQLKAKYPFAPKQIEPSASIAIETTRAEPVPDMEKKIMPEPEHGAVVTPAESRLHLENDRT